MQAVVEIENVFEILAAIVGRLFHLTNIDQVENDLAEVARVVDTPLVEHVLREHAVLLHRVLADCFAELLAGDVTFFFRFGGFGSPRAAEAELLLGESQRFKNKEIRVAVITAIASQQFSQWMIWIYHASIVDQTSDLGNHTQKNWWCACYAEERFGKTRLWLIVVLALTNPD